MRSPLFSPAWWRQIIDRSGRQAIQVMIPILAVAASGDLSGIDLQDVAFTVAIATVVVVLKAVAGLSVSPADAPGWQAIERAAGAAAGAALSLLPAKALDLLAFDWRTFTVAVVGSAAMSVAMMITSPPVGPTGVTGAQPEAA